MFDLIAALTLAASSASPILHYVRSNRDGSEREHVVQYRPTRTSLSVYKWVEKCTTAAYVTAEMTPDMRHGQSFVAGKVAKDGSQAKFGTLTFDPTGPALQAEIDPPGMGHLSERVKLRSLPYLIYDFDFADLNAFLQEVRPKRAFTFELPVIWPGSGPSMFRQLGQLRARYGGKSRRLGYNTIRFDLTVNGPTRSTGRLWIDADRGFIVEADLGLPNHQEYRDFRLSLERIEPGGQSNWDALTRGHYATCQKSPG